MQYIISAARRIEFSHFYLGNEKVKNNPQNPACRGEAKRRLVHPACPMKCLSCEMPAPWNAYPACPTCPMKSLLPLFHRGEIFVALISSGLNFGCIYFIGVESLLMSFSMNTWGACNSTGAEPISLGRSLFNRGVPIILLIIFLLPWSSVLFRGEFYNFLTTDFSPQYDSSYLRDRQNHTEILRLFKTKKTPHNSLFKLWPLFRPFGRSFEKLGMCTYSR
jgi:hypothetical protein